MSKLNKATNNDIRRYLSRALGNNGWLEDWDEEFVYFEKFVSETDQYTIFRAPYVLEGVDAIVDTEAAEEVDKSTEYVTKSWLADVLEKHFGGSKQESKLPVIKMYDDKQMIVTEPLYIAFGEVDAHGDAYKDEAAVYQLVDSFNTALEKGTIKSSFFHTHETESFTPLRAYVNEVESQLGDHTVPALQPLVDIQFNCEKAFELRKSMELLGVSIGAMATGSTSPIEKSSDSADSKTTEIRYLSQFTFDFEGSHLAYTDESIGGAASLKDQYYMIKSNKKVHLSDEQKRILELVGEEFKPLGKSVQSTPSSAEEDSAGEDNILNDENGNENMTEKEKELEKQLQEMKKALDSQALKLASKELASYGFEGEQLDSISKVFVSASDEDKEVLVKSFESLVSAKEEVEKEVAELKKSASKLPESELEGELGNADDASGEDEELSFKQRMEKARKLREEK